MPLGLWAGDCQDQHIEGAGHQIQSLFPNHPHLKGAPQFSFFRGPSISCLPYTLPHVLGGWASMVHSSMHAAPAGSTPVPCLPSLRPLGGGRGAAVWPAVSVRTHIHARWVCSRRTWVEPTEREKSKEMLNSPESVPLSGHTLGEPGRAHMQQQQRSRPTDSGGDTHTYPNWQVPRRERGGPRMGCRGAADHTGRVEVRAIGCTRAAAPRVCENVTRVGRAAAA